MPAEHATFMEQLQRFSQARWLGGGTWGLFALALPHRTGAQCRSYFHRLRLRGALPSSVVEKCGTCVWEEVELEGDGASDGVVLLAPVRRSVAVVEQFSWRPATDTLQVSCAI